MTDFIKISDFPDKMGIGVRRPIADYSGSWHAGCLARNIGCRKGHPCRFCRGVSVTGIRAIGIRAIGIRAIGIR